MRISFSALYSKLRSGRRLIDLGTEGSVERRMLYPQNNVP